MVKKLNLSSSLLLDRSQESIFLNEEESPLEKSSEKLSKAPQTEAKPKNTACSRGNYRTFSLEEKEEIISLIGDRKETEESVARRYSTTVRRIKAIFSKRGNLQKSGRKSRNLFRNQFYYEKGLEFFLKFGVRPSILALPKFFDADNCFFKSNGQKTNFTINFKKFLEKKGCVPEQVKANPFNEALSLMKLGELFALGQAAEPQCFYSQSDDANEFIEDKEIFENFAQETQEQILCEEPCGEEEIKVFTGDQEWNQSFSNEFGYSIPVMNLFPGLSRESSFQENFNFLDN